MPLPLSLAASASAFCGMVVRLGGAAALGAVLRCLPCVRLDTWRENYFKQRTYQTVATVFPGEAASHLEVGEHSLWSGRGGVIGILVEQFGCIFNHALASQVLNPFDGQRHVIVRGVELVSLVMDDNIRSSSHFIFQAQSSATKTKEATSTPIAIFSIVITLKSTALLRGRQTRQWQWWWWDIVDSPYYWMSFPLPCRGIALLLEALIPDW